MGADIQPPPISLNYLLVLRGLAGSLGFDGLLAANSHRDLLGLGFGLFGKVNLQHALVIVGAHLPRIYRAGQRERPGELSVLPLDATEVLLFLVLLDLALAMYGEGGVLDADINVFFVDARNFKLQSNVVLVLRRCPPAAGRSYLTITKDVTRVMNRIKALYRSWGIPCAGTSVYAPRHRAEWLAKLVEPGVRIRAEPASRQVMRSWLENWCIDSRMPNAC